MVYSMRWESIHEPGIVGGADLLDAEYSTAPDPKRAAPVGAAVCRVETELGE